MAQNRGKRNAPGRVTVNTEPAVPQRSRRGDRRLLIIRIVAAFLVLMMLLPVIAFFF